jgi:hypothetical protein
MGLTRRFNSGSAIWIGDSQSRTVERSERRIWSQVIPVLGRQNMRAMARDHTALVRRLQDALDGSSSGTTKTWWERYLKGAIEFRGVGIPQIRSVLADWRSDSGVGSWPLADQFALALRLFEEPMAEDKLAGILFLQEYLYDGVPWRETVRQYGSLFERGLIADWNTCDWFCVRVLGPTIASNGSVCALAVAKRSSAVLIRRDERFAKTAVGWILRDISKYDLAKVTAFVDENLPYFSTESIRNALKYSPEGKRRTFLKRMKAAQQQHAADGAARRR